MKLNLVIDASSIFYRSLFTIGAFGSSEKLLESKESRGVFMRKLAVDFTTLVKSLDNYNRVVICQDSASWRKAVLISDGGYKSDRKKDASAVNWNSFYDLTDSFVQILAQKGYIISKINGAEADDLLFLWSKKFNAENENVVLITGDRDLLQTLKHTSTDRWTIALDPVVNRKKISLVKESFDRASGLISKASTIDLFNPDSWIDDTDVLQKLVSTHETQVIDPVLIALKKVVLGDPGDSVPGIISWPDKKEPEKTRSLTENNFNKILTAIPDLSIEGLLAGNNVEAMIEIAKTLKKLDSIDVELVKKNIARNVKLVVLSEEVIPQEIQDAFKQKHVTVPYSSVVTTRGELLNGTEWWTTQAAKNTFVPKSYDLF